MQRAPPSPSGFSSDKPILSHVTIDLLIMVLNNTFLHPFFAWLLPLALRAQTYQYHHPPMWGSILYASIVTVIYVWYIIDKKLAFGANRDLDPENEVMVITGGSSGLGLLMAQAYGMRGVSVAILDIVEPEMPSRNVEFYHCDVGNNEQVVKVAKQIEQDMGTPTILVNNAAIVNGKTLLDLSIKEIDTTFQTNVLSNFYTIKAFLPGMIQLGKGSIVTVSSVLSHIGPKQLSDYAASKAAVRLLHDSLSAELYDYPMIKPLLVVPGQFSTPLFHGVKTPSTFFAPVMEPVDVAKEVMAAIDAGQGGELALPIYSKWIVAMKVMPVSVQRLLRWWSGCDSAMRGFKGREGLKREEMEEEQE